ncbi:phosphatase PAP2 family protein [Pseudonocardia sp.]|uniref:phosphatase PAP2 family protein n=1 Tax=Pseudonocardia sp. TaxID=60912 RepID=UPI0031FD4196
MPDISAEWYRDVVELAAGSSEWIRVLVEFATEAVLVVFAGMFVAMWWRARTGPPLLVARTLLVPVMTVPAYLLSRVTKDLWQEQRPCHTLADVATVAACPEHGDWSFPSTHATIAGAAAVAIAWSGARVGWCAVGVALFAAASRVFVGVHYPHDVVAGLVLGAVAALSVSALARVLAPVVADARARARAAWLVGAAAPEREAGDARTVRFRRPPR